MFQAEKHGPDCIFKTEMKKASIISIGNELLTGQTVDTNATFLTRELISINISTVTGYTVGDTIDSVVRSLKLAAEDADIIITTGGLGPTDDDLTRQGFAKFLGVKLKLQSRLLRKIQSFYASRNRQMPECNKIQAFLPEGTESMENNLGTAPGVMASIKTKLFFALPGVPSEMEEMFKEKVLPKLKNLSVGQAVVIKKLNCFGTGESNIVDKIGDLAARDRNPVINFTVNRGIITLHIIATAKDQSTARQMAEKDQNLLTELLGNLIYGTDDQTLAEAVADKLTKQKKTIATAESCTGGLLAKLLTDIPGSSAYFTQGWVTYSNDAKIRELSIPPELIEKFGAVSKETAQAIAISARDKAQTSYAIGITGIAGPTGGTRQKPLGLVYISIADEKLSKTERFIFSHDRASIRNRAANTALNMLRLRLDI